MSSINNTNTLSSLAMLKVSIDSGKDYLEYLRPYVIQVLMESPPDVVADASVAEKLRSICGLEIPHRTVHVVLQRLANDGYLRRSQGVYTVVKELPAKDNSADRADARRHIGAVTHSLVQFAKQSAERDISDDVATECLIVFLSQFSIPCLKYYLRGTTLPNVNGHSNWQITLVSQFINDLTLKPDLFESFMKLVQGHMLANALLCPDLKSVSKSYKDVVFFFDTPLLIQFLGLEGKEEKQAIDEVIGLVQRLEGKIACFSHTCEELVNVIRKSADFVDSPHGRGTIVEEARKLGTTKSDIILIAQNASDLLKAAKITVHPTPPYDSKTYQFEISEEVFASVLREEVNYHNPKAKEYDVKSVRSVYILRRGLFPFSIEKSRAVLVTNNSGFSKAAYEYGKKFEQSQEVSTVITDFSLANTAWLKAPQGAPSLPRKEVLAFAYAALRPTTEFWKKVLDEAEKLETRGKISSLDHQLLRSSHHVQSELMKLTLGEDDALTEESITTTLSRVSAEIRKEESERFNQSEAARLKTEQKLAEQVAKTEAQVAKTNAIKQGIYWRCDRQAGREALALSILVWVIQASVAVFGFLRISESSKFGWVMAAIGVLSGLVRLAGTHWEIKPIKFHPLYKEWRRARLQKAEYAALSIEDES
jgi:hypothetical protein